MSEAERTELAQQIVERIELDILGRSGIGNELEQCDEGIRDEIRATWTEIVVSKLDAVAV